MQIAKHNFFFNVAGATAGNDPKLAKNIVMNEYANLITQNPKSVIAALNASGIPTAAGASTQTIIDNLWSGKNTKALVKNLNQVIGLKYGKLKLKNGKKLPGKLSASGGVYVTDLNALGASGSTYNHLGVDGDDDSSDVTSSDLAGGSVATTSPSDNAAILAEFNQIDNSVGSQSSPGYTPAGSGSTTNASSPSIWSKLGALGMGILAGATAPANKASTTQLAANRGATVGGLSAMAWVGILIGVAAIGTIIYFATKKPSLA